MRVFCRYGFELLFFTSDVMVTPYWLILLFQCVFYSSQTYFMSINWKMYIYIFKEA